MSDYGGMIWILIIYVAVQYWDYKKNLKGDK